MREITTVGLDLAKNVFHRKRCCAPTFCPTS
jgi:hypothetical protein